MSCQKQTCYRYLRDIIVCEIEPNFVTIMTFVRVEKVLKILQKKKKEKKLGIYTF